MNHLARAIFYEHSKKARARHKWTEGRAPVRGSEFITKATTTQTNIKPNGTEAQCSGQKYTRVRCAQVKTNKDLRCGLLHFGGGGQKNWCVTRL
jgi:hypothetical protein